MTLSSGTVSGSNAATSTFEVDNTLTLTGGTLKNYTVNASTGGQTIAIGQNASITLSGDVVNANLNFFPSTNTNESDFVKVVNSLTLNGVANLTSVPASSNGGGSSLDFIDTSGPQTLNSSGNGKATINLGNGTTDYVHGGELAVEDGVNLTLGSGVTIEGFSGIVGARELTSKSLGNSLTNDGLITSNMSNGEIYVQSDTFINNGTLSAANGGTLNLASSNMLLNGVLDSDSTSKLYLTGTVNNQGTALTVGAGALILSGGTIVNAVIGSSGTGAGLITAERSTSTLSGDILNTTLNYSPYSNATVSNIKVFNSLTLNSVANVTSVPADSNGGASVLDFVDTSSPQTLSSGAGSTGFVNLGNGTTDYVHSGEIAVEDGVNLTIGSGITIQGFAGTIGNKFSTTTSLGNSVTNNGLITANVSNGEMYVQSDTFINNGTLSALNGGTLNLASTNMLLNGVLLADSTSTLELTGTVNNQGTALTIGAGALTLAGGTITNAVIGSTGTGIGLTTAERSTNTLNGDVLDTTLNFSAYSNATVSTVKVMNSLILNGVANVTSVPADSNGGASVLDFVDKSSAQTLNSNGGNTATVNLGNGTTDYIHQGQIAIEDGVSLTLGSGVTVQGFNGIIGNKSTTTTSLGNSLTNNGTIVSNESGGAIYVQSDKFINSGTLTAANGGIFAITPILTNTGTVSVASGASMTAAAGISQTAGSMTVNGTLTIARGSTLTLLGGSLSGTGTVAGNVTNTSGNVGPGNAVGTLAINGSYTQGSGGTLTIDLSGTNAGSFSSLLVSGTASINGLLDVNLVNGFIPKVGQAWIILSSSSESGLFDMPVTDSAGDSYTVTTAGVGQLKMTVVGMGSSSAPEPRTIVLILLGAAMLLHARRQVTA